MEAFIAMHPMLKEKYMGEHVAIYDGKLIDQIQILQPYSSVLMHCILTSSFGWQL